MKNIFSIECDIWEYLASCGKKIIMYGMGNGADKILAICNEKGIEISDFFASDDFVRGHLFHGKKVLTYSQIKEKYSNFVVLLSFATALPEVIHRIDSIASETELLIPDVPVFGNTLFDINFYKQHIEDFERTYELFADERSKEIYKNVIYAKLTGNPRFLNESVTEKEEVYRDILNCEKYISFADLGAYNGDTIRELSQYSPNLKKVHALEPDKRTFRKLSDYAASETRFEILCHNYAAWNRNETIYFDGSGNRNSNVSVNTKTLSGKRPVEITARSLDSILKGEKVDYIKYDVEGSEFEALEGSAETIKKHNPDLMVSLYHRSEDVFVLPHLVQRLGSFKMYLRRFRYYPAWDLNLYCVKY